MGTIDLRANRSSVFAHGTYDTGGGQDDHLPIGYGSGLEMRGAFDFPAISWAGVTGIDKAELELTSTSQVHIARGSSPQANAYRITEQWTPNGATDDGSGNWTTSPDAYPGPSATSSGGKLLSAGDANERTDKWDVTAIVRAWAPTSAGGSGSKQYGIALRPVSGTSHNAEWYSAEYGTSSKRPRLIITTRTSSPPSKPTPIAPLGPNADGRTYRFTTNRTPTSWDLDVATEYTFANIIWAPRTQTGGISGSSVAAPYAGPVYVPGVPYYWRARVRDAQGTSAWSSTSSFTADPNPSGRDPWDEWASAILEAQRDPRLALRVATVRPEGPDVARLVTADMGAMVRLDLSDTETPLRAQALLLGMTVQVDSGGWTLDPILGSLTAAADDWYGASELYPDRVLSGELAPIPSSYWSLGETSGTFVDAVSGWSGSVTGTPTRGAPALAGTDGALAAVNLAGGAQYGNIYAGGLVRSCLAWVRWDAGANLYVVDKVAGAAGTYTGWRFSIASDGSLRFLHTIAGGQLATITSAPVVLTPGRPSLVGVVQRNTGEVRLFIDGALVKVATWALVAATSSQATRTLPGGAVDELAFWHTIALTDEQMGALWRG